MYTHKQPAQSTYGVGHVCICLGLTFLGLDKLSGGSAEDLFRHSKWNYITDIQLNHYLRFLNL